MSNIIHDPYDFSGLEVIEKSPCRTPIPVEQSSPDKCPDFHQFSKLPTEIQSIVWEIAARPLAQRRVVEIHEVELEVKFRYAYEPDYDHNLNIKHFRSMTISPLTETLFKACRESRRQVWKHFDESRHLGNELCADMVYFNFSRDWAYLTQDTLHNLMRFWKRCSDQHPEFPWNDGAGEVLRTHLRYLVFDASILSGDDICMTPQHTVVFGNEEIMKALGPGLASFSSLEEIILVQAPVADASVDEGLSSINLFEPQKDTYPDFLLKMAAGFLRQHLDHYFNKFEYKRPKPPSTVPRKPRKIPVVKAMFKGLQ